MKARLTSCGHFIADLIRAQYRDQLMLRAGALAYTTLMSIVPLLTVALVTVGRVQPERAEVVVRAIATVLPFSPSKVQATLQNLAQRTAALGWVAVAISILVTFQAFYQIEEVINSIWGVPRRRRWQWRLLSFSAVLFWGPLLLTALFSGLFWLSSLPGYPGVAPLARPLPALLIVIVLAGLYRAVPHTDVPWRAAVIGAAVAAVALTALHLGFQTYLLFASDLNVIYGSLAIMLLFLVSLFLFWFAVLLGAEASWVVGHRRAAAHTDEVHCVIRLLVEAELAGHVSREHAVDLLGERAGEMLTSLMSCPPILVSEGEDFRLARAADTVTLGEIRARAGFDAAGAAGVSLAALAKRASTHEADADMPPLQAS